MILTKRASRIAAVAFGLTFFVTAGVDALGFHECPHHDAIGAPVSGQEAGSGEPTPDGHEAGGDHEGHDGHAAVHSHATGADVRSAATPAPADHGDHAGPCTCVGSCQLGGQSHMGPALGGQEIALPPMASANTVRNAHRHVAHLPGPPAFFLPFANAPPGLDAFSV